LSKKAFLSQIFIIDQGPQREHYDLIGVTGNATIILRS
jgi:hypothetical protein